MKEANQFVFFKFGFIRLLDIMNFLGGATCVNSSLKTYNTIETRRFFPYEWLGYKEKVNNREILPYDFFLSILRNSNLLEEDYINFQNLFKSGLSKK